MKYAEAQSSRRSTESLRAQLLLYAVTDDALLSGRNARDCVRDALQGGATFIQLRKKHAATAAIVEEANALLPVCREYGAPLIINDDVEAARICGADGVHVGQSDESCARAREMLGPHAIVGVSVQTVAQALAAEEAGADYLGVGAVFPTSTKRDADLVSLAELRAICDAVRIPVVAIGGITPENVNAFRGIRVSGVAVVSAIFAAKDILAASATLRNQIEAIIC